MKKLLLSALALLCAATASFAVACGDDSSLSNSSSNSSSTKKTVVLNDEFANATGKATYNATGTVTLEVSSERAGTFLGAEGAEELTVDGGADGATVRATGQGVGAIQAKSGGKLIFKNCKIEDRTTRSGDDGRMANYLDWGGKLRFENCTFSDSIFLDEEADAEFIGCTFQSQAADLYSVWMADGSVSFKDCTFKGWRGLKIHEQPQYDMEIVSVVLDGCTFYDLRTKPGLAIGDIRGQTTDTTITIKNCAFDGCQNWDDEGSLEGINGFYEADTLTSLFVFTVENTEIDGINAEEFDPEYKIP